MNSTSIERKYVLTKLDVGDYLLPSNDGLTIWRIARYTDGPSGGLDWPRDIDLWGCWKWNERGLPTTSEDIDDWDRWDRVIDGYDTRAKAIEAALRESP